MHRRARLTTPPPGFDWDPFTNGRCEREYGFSFLDLVQLFDDAQGERRAFNEYNGVEND
jgi:hypothetical protein